MLNPLQETTKIELKANSLQQFADFLASVEVMLRIQVKQSFPVSGVKQENLSYRIWSNKFFKKKINMKYLMIVPMRIDITSLL